MSWCSCEVPHGKNREQPSKTELAWAALMIYSTFKLASWLLLAALSQPGLGSSALAGRRLSTPGTATREEQLKHTGAALLELGPGEAG